MKWNEIAENFRTVRDAPRARIIKIYGIRNDYDGKLLDVRFFSLDDAKCYMDKYGGYGLSSLFHIEIIGERVIFE